jgi:outer membrane protein OmpA-like peptidoglycan-associated protein
MRLIGILKFVLTCLLVTGLCACAHTKPKPPPGPTKAQLQIIELEHKTAQLMQTSEELHALQQIHADQRRRLTVICTDHPDHQVCQPQTARQFALDAFCSDRNFVTHVDEIVSACHQGQCKQVDDAKLLARTQYRTLVSRLPHKLITFGHAKSKLDRGDKRDLQQFIEAIQGEHGYVIVVGRASRDGPWRKNVRLALNRAENARKFIVDDLGMNEKHVGYITYGHEKMYLTSLDAERLGPGKLSTRQANRSALIFSYPCFQYQSGY